ncbi:chromosome segregation in meiosis- protein [Dimargaris verticillata]|uniref:Chromosome segregation in meiosis protein n=1 Tax=Dimargaris verticillata TaxID=2761393 RepID=A0A9W8AY63_9FUNG|nr:chromosome segregation in meiosis- protein [Dimargaris verticillata]
MNAPQSVSHRRAAPEKPWTKAAAGQHQAPIASSNAQTATLDQPAPLAADQQPSLDPNGSELDQLQAVRKRKKVARLDAEKMLAPEGLKYLQSQGPRLKFYGPGHEAQDLAKLMQFYRLWAHQLFPKLQFAEFICEAEKVCSQKRLRVHLDEWKKAQTTALHQGSPLSPHRPADVQDAPGAAVWSTGADAVLPLDTHAGGPVDHGTTFIGTSMGATTFDSSSGDSTAATTTPTSSSAQLSNEAQRRIEENRARAMARLEASRRRTELQMQQEPDFDAFSDDELDQPSEPAT